MKNPKFGIGEVIRYGFGPTALMRVSYISRRHDGHDHRYYGQQCLSGIQGAYESDCRKASKLDLQEWKVGGEKGGWRTLSWEAFQEKYKNSDVVGAYED